MYKMKNKLEKLSFENYFQLPKTQTTQGHLVKVFKPHALNKSRANFWSVRAVDNWNSLPESVVKADTLNVFKNGLDRFWKEHMYTHDS
jgi:hypothetical protein